MDAHSDSGRAEAKRIRLRARTVSNRKQFTFKPPDMQAELSVSDAPLQWEQLLKWLLELSTFKWYRIVNSVV